MKKNNLLLLFLFITLTLTAQEATQKKSGRFGLSFSGIALVQEDWETDNMRYYDGGTYNDSYYHEKIFYTIGFNYLEPVNAWMDIETGLEYSRKLGEITYVFLGDEIIKKANSTMASIPLIVRANFLRFFFVNAGLQTDFDLGGHDSYRYQSGIGPVVGLGIKYDFKSGAQLYINPYFKRRAYISFSENEDRLKKDESGIRVGFYFGGKKG